MALRVVTDSSCDLPSEVADELGVEIVPLTVRFGEEELVDRRDLTVEGFWSRMAEAATLPETAAPSPGAFEEAFRRLVAGGATGILCVTISGELSATVQSARLGADAVAADVDVRVLDSRTVSMGLGAVAAAAARAAAAGEEDLGALARRAEEQAARTRVFAALDTLENLKRGGRIGAAQAFLGSVLSIKPVIEVRDGAVEPESRQRTRAKALRHLVAKLGEHERIDNVAVMHGAAPDVDQFVDALAEVHPRDRIMVGQVGAVIGTHAGPGVMGVTFTVEA